MTARFINHPGLLVHLALAAVIAIAAATAPGSASATPPDHLPGYPYATLSSVSR